MKLKENLVWASGGALAGAGIATALRIPVFFIMANCECPELGLVEAYALFATVGALIGLLANIRKQKRGQKKT